MNIPAFLHCAAAPAASAAAKARADICWVAGDIAEDVIECCVQLHYTMNVSEWLQPNATSFAHVDRTSNSPGAIAANSHTLQLFVGLGENMIALGSVPDGTKLGNFLPVQQPSFTQERLITGRRNFDIAAQVRRLDQEMRAELARQQENGQGEGAANQAESSSSAAAPEPRVEEDFFSAPIAGSGSSASGPLATTAAHQPGLTPEILASVQQIQNLNAARDDRMLNSDTLLSGEMLGAQDFVGQGRENPFKRLNADSYVVRFMCEIVRKDPDYLAAQRAVQLGEGIVGDGEGSRFCFDQRTGQVRYAELTDLISLFEFLGKQMQSREAHDLCEQNAEQFRRLARYFGTAPAPELPEGVRPFRLEEHLDEVDSFTFSIFTTMNFDPAILLIDMITAANIRELETPGSALASTVVDAIMRQTEALQVPRPKKQKRGPYDRDVDRGAHGVDDAENTERLALRKPNSKTRTQIADHIRQLVNGTAGLTLERYMGLAAMYCNDDGMLRDWLQRKRATIDGLRDQSSPYHILNVFSFQNAMKQRSPHCRREQSAVEYAQFLQEATAAPGSDYVCSNFLYTDMIPNSMGVYQFVYPLPDQVLMYNPAQVKLSQFLNYPLPHCSVERKHPLAERAPHLYEELAAASGQSNTERRQRAVHDFSALESVEMPTAQRQALMDHRRALSVLHSSQAFMRATVSPDVNTRSALGAYARDVAEVGNTAPDLARPFDLTFMTTSSVHAAVQELSNRVQVEGQISQMEVAMEMAKALTSVVRSAVRQIPGAKRRAALEHVHARTMLDLYRAECDPHLPNSEAFQAIQWCKLNGKIHSGERRLRPVRVAPHLPGYANLMALMSNGHYYVKHMLYARHITKMYILSLTACSNKFGLAPNVLAKGDGGVSKSASLEAVPKNRVGYRDPESQKKDNGDMAGMVGMSHPSQKTTSEKLGDKTANAFTSEQTYLLDHKMLYRDEVDTNTFTGGAGPGNGQSGNRDVSADSRDKDMRTSSICTKIRLVWQSETGQAVMKRFLMILRSWWAEATNAPTHGMEDSFLQRALHIIFAKPKDGEPNPINMVMTAAAMPAFLGSSTAGSRIFSAEELQRMHHELHCFTTDLFNLVDFGAMEPINECVAWLILGNVDDWVRRHGGDGLIPRQLSMIMDTARILMIIDLYASEVLFPGGRLYGQDWALEDFLKLDPLLYIAPDHVYTAIGMLHPHMVIHGRRELGFATRSYLDSLFQRLSTGGFCAQRPSVRAMHYYLCDHVFAPDSATLTDRRRANTQGGFGQRQPPPDEQQQQEGGHDGSSGRNLDYERGDYALFDLDYVILRIGAYGLEGICAYICGLLKNIPEVEMIPPVRSLTGAIASLQDSQIFAPPMRANIPAEPLQPGQRFGLKEDLQAGVVPLVVASGDKSSFRRIPICKVQNGRLLVSTYFLTHDISNEELMQQAIRALNNHANEAGPRDVLYGDHQENPHYSTLRVGRFVMPDGREERDIRKNPAAYKNLRLPNPSKMTKGVKDVLMGGATTGMTPEQKRMRVELLRHYKGSPVFEDMLREFSKPPTAARSEDFDEPPMSGEAMRAGREEVEEMLGRPVSPGEFEEDIRVCGAYAQTHAYLLTAEQLESDKIEIHCPLADLARQMRAQQIDLCPEPITRKDVEFAVDHFGEWIKRSHQDPRDVRLTDEERARFGEWRDVAAIPTGMDSLDGRQRPAIISRTAGPRIDDVIKETMRDYGMDALAASLQATSLRSQVSVTSSIPASRPEDASAPAGKVHHGWQTHKIQYVMDDELDMMVLDMEFGRPPRPGQSVPRESAPASATATETEEARAAREAEDQRQRELQRELDDIRALASASRDECRGKRWDKLREASEAAERETKRRLGTGEEDVLVEGDCLVCTPNDWVYDVQMDPVQFCVPNPVFKPLYTVDPFCNARYVPDWTLKARPHLGVAPGEEHVMNRRALYKMHYAYSAQWLIDRANMMDPHRALHEQRRTYPEYLILSERDLVQRPQVQASYRNWKARRDALKARAAATIATTGGSHSNTHVTRAFAAASQRVIASGGKIPRTAPIDVGSGSGAPPSPVPPMDPRSVYSRSLRAAQMFKDGQQQIQQQQRQQQQQQTPFVQEVTDAMDTSGDEEMRAGPSTSYHGI